MRSSPQRWPPVPPCPGRPSWRGARTGVARRWGWVRRRALDTCEHLPEDMRRDWLSAALAHRGAPDDALVRARAAELLDISPSTIYRKRQRWIDGGLVLTPAG